MFFIEEEFGECLLIRWQQFYDVQGNCFVLLEFEGCIRAIQAELKHGYGELAMFFAEGEEKLNILLDIGNDLRDVEEDLRSKVVEVELLVEGDAWRLRLPVPTLGTFYIAMVYKMLFNNRQ